MNLALGKARSQEFIEDSNVRRTISHQDILFSAREVFETSDFAKVVKHLQSNRWVVFSAYNGANGITFIMAKIS